LDVEVQVDVGIFWARRRWLYGVIFWNL